MATELIKSLVDKNRENVISRLPKYLSPESFFQLCYAMDRMPKLAQVAQRNPDSILNAVFRAADCGLMVGSAYEHCWIIPYGDEANFQIGWKGFVYLWIRAGAILGIDAQCVYNGDHIEVSGGDTPKIFHRVKLDDPRRDDHRWLYDPKNIIGAYAIATLPTGLKARRYCPKGEIEFSRSRSPGARKEDSPWNHNYPAMARKTPIRRLNGVIQVCGPTPENQEAWERYSRTLELDRGDFRVVDDEDAIDLTAEDDMPGPRTPKKGAAPASESPPSPGEKTSGARTAAPAARSAAQRGSDVAPPLEPPPTTKPLADDDLIPMEKEDELIAQAEFSHMKPSELRVFVKEKYGVPNINQLRNSQAHELGLILRERADAPR